MLEKDTYDSWKSRMELYMLNRQHGRMILEFVENGPLLWPTVEENEVSRSKKYYELSTTKAIQANCDVKEKNIIFQGLPPEVYALVSTHKVLKELRERIQMLMQGTSLTKQERECKLYDEFDKFAYKKRESLRDFYLRFSLLLNDMNIYNLKLEQFQANTKFLNTLPPGVPKGDDPIDAINHMMTFLTTVVTSQRQNSLTAGMSRQYTSRTSGTNSVKQRVIVYYNCKGEGHMSKHCTKPKRKRDEAWFKDKVLLFQAQANRQVFHEEELDFLADPRIAETQSTQTMDMTIDQQVAMDEALVPHAHRLRIGRSNFCLLSDISSKESTLQLVYDVLRLTPFFRAFLVTADVLKIYMQEFWATATVHHHSIREMLHIYPILPNKPFVEPPIEEHIMGFLRFLRHSGAIRRLIDVNINKLHQPWRSFVAIINKCLTGKNSSYDSLRLSWAQILLGLYHKRNVDFTFLMWEDFVYQVEHKDTKKSNEMYYPRDDHMFTTIKLISRHQNTQQFGDDDSDDEGDDGDDDDEANGEENLGMNVGREEGQDDQDEEDELYRDVNINLGRGIQMGDVHTTQEFEDSHVTLTPTPTSVAPPLVSAPTLTPSTISTITTTQEAPTLPTTAPSTLLQDLPNFSSLFRFDHRLKTLEENFSEFTQTNQFAGAVSSILGIVHRYMDQQINEAVKVAVQLQSDRLCDEAQKENDEFLKTIGENMQKIIKEQVKEQVKTSYVIAADLSKMELKKILIEKIEGNKYIHRSNEERNLYKALVKEYESDKIILDTYGEIVTLKRRRDDDVNKDEEPSAGSDRGSKRRRKGKEPDESATAEEPMQTTFEMEEPSHPEFETGVDDQPIVEPSQHPEWFSQQKKPPIPDCDWNKTLPTTHGSIQPWISELAKLSDSRSSFNELMDTPVDFSAFLMNWLKVETLTPELLDGPTYELMKGSCKILVELEFFLEEVYKATTDQLDLLTPKESARDVYSKRRIIAITELKIVEWHNYKHLDWITVHRDDDKLYKFKEGDFKRLCIQDIKDMLLLLVQGKLTYLTVEECFAFNVSLRMFTRSIIAYSNPRGFIYQNKDKQNMLMRIDELHKFSDGTLIDVPTALNDHLKGIRIKYLPQSIWRKGEKDKAAAMIQAIDKMLKTRRIMRSLERFVVGRL
nr:hypothetical protein [Tanacetum cinerariifolium]